LFRGFWYALATLALELPLVLALGSAVLASGSLRLVDIISRQGAAPWTWNAFKSPPSFVAFVLVIAASFPEVERQRSELADADLEPPPPGGIMFYVGWCHLLVVSALAAMLFLGGFRLPPQPLGVSANGWLALGALVLQLKCWAVAGLVVFLRWALPRVRVDQVGSLFWRWLLPISLVAVIGNLAWTNWQRSPFVRSAEPVFGYVLFGLTTFGIVKFVRGVWGLVRAPNAPMHVNPWL
jgi:NADH-quinone oxidoreductase subunit H